MELIQGIAGRCFSKDIKRAFAPGFKCTFIASAYGRLQNILQNQDEKPGHAVSILFSVSFNGISSGKWQDPWCQDSTIVRFLRIDPMVTGSSPTSAKLSLRVRRVASSL